jgi:hypothetical protein
MPQLEVRVHPQAAPPPSGRARIRPPTVGFSNPSGPPLRAVDTTRPRRIAAADRGSLRAAPASVLAGRRSMLPTPNVDLLDRRLPRLFRDPLEFRGDGFEAGCPRHLSLLRFRDPAFPSLGRVPWGRFPGFTGVGSKEAPLRIGAGLRPPLKPDVQISRIQLSRRHVNSEMRSKEPATQDRQAPTRREGATSGESSIPHIATFCTDATTDAARSIRRVDERACEHGNDSGSSPIRG